MTRNACRVKGVKMGGLAITQEFLRRMLPNLVCGWRPSSDAHRDIPQVMGGLHLQVRTCARADVPPCFLSQERPDGLP